MNENDMPTNKEIIAKLVQYFLTQDPHIIAHLLANHMIDMNRIYHMGSIGHDERECLLMRIEKNYHELIKFIKHGPDGDIKLHNMNSENKRDH